MVEEILQHLELAIPKGLDFCVRLGQLLGFASITNNQQLMGTLQIVRVKI